MHNLFGTDGIRGRMGTGLFVQKQLIQLGKAIAYWTQTKYSKNPHILLFHDTRISASFVKAALKTGLLQHAVIIEDAGVLPTPAGAHLMKLRPEIDCALIISASHNPYADNGIKIMDARTGKLTLADEESISSYISNAHRKTRWFDTFCLRKTLTMSGFPLRSRLRYHSITNLKPLVVSDFEEIVSNHAAYGLDNSYLDAQELYSKIITQLFPHNFLAGKCIVLDTAHGATFHVAPKIFQQLGAEVIVINNQPTGYNINEACGALHTQAVADAIQDHAADIGFAFDGDGDRVIAVNRHGQVKDGDDMLALLLTHPQYSACNQIVGTIMTNEGFAHYLHQQNKQLIRTPVGDKYIAEKLSTQNWLLGGEPSGHIILHDILNTGDGILVALRILEVICRTNNWDMETFEHYPQVMINVSVAVRKDLETEPLKNIIVQAQEHLPTGRILVRYSGTENLLRVMVETDNSHDAHAVCQQLAHKLSQAL